MKYVHMLTIDHKGKNNHILTEFELISGVISTHGTPCDTKSHTRMLFSMMHFYLHAINLPFVQKLKDLRYHPQFSRVDLSKTITSYFRSSSTINPYIIIAGIGSTHTIMSIRNHNFCIVAAHLSSIVITTQVSSYLNFQRFVHCY